MASSQPFYQLTLNAAAVPVARLALPLLESISQYCKATTDDRKKRNGSGPVVCSQVLCADTRPAPIVAKSHTSLFSFLQWNRMS